MSKTSTMVRDGIVAGLLGAAAVALWFLIIDLMQGRPFTTPSVLGQVLLFNARAPATSVAVPGAVAAYTALHLAVFMLLGIGANKLVEMALQSSLWRFALVMVTVVFELFFWGLVEIGFAATRGLFPFWTVLVGNTLAVLAMVWYLSQCHPSLKRVFLTQPIGN